MTQNTSPQTDAAPDRARIAGFYRLSVAERVDAIAQQGLIDAERAERIKRGDYTLSAAAADKMIENVIGVFGMPWALGLNFLINGKPYAVPLVVEEPSIVAALSSAAKTARAGGGFKATSSDPILIGQVQIVGVPHAAQARARLIQRKEQIINLANSLHPKMVARGGGARDVEVFLHPSNHESGDMLVLHLLVDTRDAMGANLVNTMCEGIAGLVEKISGGQVFLRILSNLHDRSMVRAETTIPLAALASKNHDPEQVRDGIVIASEFASIDPYRAATHNKGIMNGVDAVAIATGNDWRAIEAGAHAYAARGSRYTALTRWTRTDRGDLHGQIDIPIKVGIVGGPLGSNPAVRQNLDILAVESAQELAEVMGAVGLAQNFSAIRALASDGIQQGHMTLHARTVAMAAGATPDIYDTVVERLVESSEIKVWKARDIVQTVRKQSHANLSVADPELQCGSGKTILLGEHAVVYGRRAMAVPVPLAVEARVRDADDGEGITLAIPRWGLEQRLATEPERRHSFERPAAVILEQLGLLERAMRIEVFPNVPRAMGLGGSAATAVAIVRALDAHFDLKLNRNDLQRLALESEKVAHGNPSGIDNTVAASNEALLYRRGNPPEIEALTIGKPATIVIGMTGVESLTAKMVARVQRRHQRNPELVERLFDEIDGLTMTGAKALADGDLTLLGELMNVNHGLLNALEVSCWELEEMIQLARNAGALGAKLTGAGGGGSMIALAEDDGNAIVRAFEDAGYQAMPVKLAPTK